MKKFLLKFKLGHLLSLTVPFKLLGKFGTFEYSIF